MPATLTPIANLRRPLLPFFNYRTLAALLVMSFVIWQVSYPLLSHEDAMRYCYLLMLVQLTPLVIALTRRHFTYMSLIMLNHFLTLTLNKYNLLSTDPNILVEFPELISSLKEQIFCSVLMILVYGAFRIFLFQGMAEKERFQELVLNRRQLLYLISYIAIVPLFIYSLPSGFLIIHFLLMGADMIMLFSAESPGNEILMWVFKGLAIVLAYRYFLETGMLTMMGTICLLFFFIGSLKRSRSMLALALLFTVVTAMIQSVKADFRTTIRENLEMPMMDRNAAVSDLLGAKYFASDPSIGTSSATWADRWDSIVAGFGRAGDDSMERVLALTPSKVPFWGGETYASLPFMFIPRFLWPDKPTRHFWNKYGRVYGVLSEDDYQTSVGVSYLAEGYMNFGYPGMYAVALLVAFIIAIVERLSFVVMRGNFYFSFLVYMIPLMPPATDLGSMLNSLFVLFGVTVVLRPYLLRMAQRDDYS